MVGLARAATLAPAAHASRRTTTGAGLFVPVGCGALALGVLALGVPLHFNAVAWASSPPPWASSSSAWRSR
jgi:hypothetical protein